MKIFTTILKNIKDVENYSEFHLEKISLSADDLLKKVIVKTTDHGTEIGIKKENIKDIFDGDVLEIDEANKKALVVILEKAEVIIIKPKSINQIAEVAHNLGNRHTQAQFKDDTMIIPYDYLIEEYLVKMGTPFEVTKIKLEKAFRHVDDAK